MSITATQWQGQDVLQLTEDQWFKILQEIVDTNAFKMIDFVYRQPNCSSTASDIADFFHIHYNYITAWNRCLAKKLYDRFEREAPGDAEGAGLRYWNVVFDGNPNQPQDNKKHFYWRLRPNLIKAYERFLQQK